MKRILPILILLGIAAGALAINPYMMVIARKNAGGLSAKGQYCLSIEDNSAIGNTVRSVWDQGSATASWYVQGYFLVSNLGTESTDNCTIFTLEANTTLSSDCAYLKVETDPGPVYNLSLFYRNTSAVTLSSASTEIALNTWYGFRFKWIANQGSGGVEFHLDLDQDGSFETSPSIADTSTFNRNGRAIGLNKESQDVDDTQTVYFDMIKADSTGFPDNSLSAWTADANILNEGFEDETDGYDNTWTETETHGTVTVKVTHPAGLP